MSARRGETLYWFERGFRRLAWRAYGDAANPPVVCVHGLTRNGGDFSALAEALADRFFVVVPDLPGHGASERLPDPARYETNANVAALASVLAAIGRPVAWVGTSQGGICGMVAAAAAGTPVARLVLNDVGPFMPAAGFADIARPAAGQARLWRDRDEAEAALRARLAPFGACPEALWHAVADASLEQGGDGLWRPACDPALFDVLGSFGAEARDVDRWWLWDRIACPVLAIRGAESTFLTAETLARMGARAETHTVRGAGHAPWLADPDSIEKLRAFLGSTRAEAGGGSPLVPVGARTI